MHLEYIYSASNLKAFIHGIEQVRDLKKVKEIVDCITVKAFKPKTGVKIKEVDDDESDNIGDDDELLIEKLTKILRNDYNALTTNVNLRPVDFEKDDDSNFHMDFITTFSNLRAENYDIAPTDKHNVIFYLNYFEYFSLF